MTGNEKGRIIIQLRDKNVLQEAAVMRVADSVQLRLAGGFNSVTRGNARFLALTRAGLLRRFYLGTDGAGQKALYALSRKGADLVQVPYRGPRRAQNELLVADFSVIHQLRVNQVYCTVKHRPIPDSTAKFVRWESFHEPIDRAKSLIPDGFFQLATAGKAIAVFLEVDLGHEGLTVWRHKVQHYVRYAASGEFAKGFGAPQFRALVVTDSERRMQSLRQATAALTTKIFWFTTFSAMDHDGFWSAIWLRISGDTRLPLL
jgi:hypothetical protein